MSSTGKGFRGKQTGGILFPYQDAPMACCADFIYPTRQFPAGLHLAPGGVLPLLYTPGRGFIRVVWNKARFLMQRFLHSSCPYFHLDRRCNFLCIECLPGLFLRTFIREIPKSPQPCFLPEVIDSSAIVLEPIIQFAVDVGLRHALSFRHGRILQFFVKSIFKMVIDYHLIAGLCFLFASIKRGVRFLPHLPVQAGMKLCYVIVELCKLQIAGRCRKPFYGGVALQVGASLIRIAAGVAVGFILHGSGHYHGLVLPVQILDSRSNLQLICCLLQIPALQDFLILRREKSIFRNQFLYTFSHRVPL